MPTTNQTNLKRPMKIFRKILLGIAALVLIIAGMFFYFVYVPKPPEPELSGNYARHTLESNFITRNFSSYTPKGLSEGSALIFVLHGSKGNGDQIRTTSAYEFDLLADKLGFIVVYPDGYMNHWNDCRVSADYAANTQDIDDTVFFTDMIAFFSDSGLVDFDKIYVTGHSNGGHMAYRLALEIPERFAAVAPISANLPVNENLGCNKSGKPISIAIFNGTNDPINPFEGGLVTILGNTSRGEVLSSEDTAIYWKDLAGIKRPASVIPHPETDGVKQTSISEQRWLGESGIQVRLYTLSGSGHVIPSKIAHFPRLLGGDAGDLSGPDEIVTFFLNSRNH